MGTGVDALIVLAHDDFAAAAIDVLLPRISGLELCRHDYDDPAGCLPACDAIEDRVFGVDSGADDYLTKPFAFAELCARIDGRPLALSVKEFCLLRRFAARAQTAVSRVEILDEVWGSSEHFESTMVDQHVSYLPWKLESGDAGVHITTVRGARYQLDIDTGQA